MVVMNYVFLNATITIIIIAAITAISYIYDELCDRTKFLEKLTGAVFVIWTAAFSLWLVLLMMGRGILE